MTFCPVLVFLGLLHGKRKYGRDPVKPGFVGEGLGTKNPEIHCLNVTSK
jgi:hypothetical protein